MEPSNDSEEERLAASKRFACFVDRLKNEPMIPDLRETVGRFKPVLPEQEAEPEEMRRRQHRADPRRRHNTHAGRRP